MREEGRSGPSSRLRGASGSSTLRWVERSEEIRRVVERWTKAIGEGDADSVLGRLSEHPGTVIVGTDADEWSGGHETHAIWGRQIEELGSSFQVAEDVIEAWEEGTVGWASVKETITVAGKELCIARDLRPPPRARRVEGRAGALVIAQSQRGSLRARVDSHARGVGADDPARAARPFSFACCRRYGHDRLHGHRRLDPHALPVRRPCLGRSHSASQRGDRGGHCRARRYGRRDPGRRIHARLLERSPGGRVRTGDPARDRTELRRLLTADPGPDRHPHRRRH